MHRFGNSTPLAEESTEFWQFAARPIVFMRPAYTAKSGWHEHVPFAFWLTETLKPRCIVELGAHYGVSYFAFCQAVKALGLDTTCYAVDTWKGDEHAGFYGEVVYQTVEEENNSQYSLFSRLVRSRFEDALSHFADGQIDLLHIDGHHSLESVRDDFNHWLPKLSRKAIVVLHDTNVRERGFGVYQFFDEVKKAYPSFEFLHGHGLGVLGVGKDISSEIQQFFNLSHQTELQQAFRELFSRVGRACDDAYWAGRHKREVSELSKVVEAQRVTIDAQLKRIEEKQTALVAERKSQEKLSNDLNGVASILDGFRRQLGAKDEEIASERAKLESAMAKVNEVALSFERTRLKLEITESYLKQEKEDHHVAAGRLEQEFVHAENLHLNLAAKDREISLLEDKLSSSEELVASIEALKERAEGDCIILRQKVEEYDRYNIEQQKRLEIALLQIADLQMEKENLSNERISIEFLLQESQKSVSTCEEALQKLREDSNLKATAFNQKNLLIEQLNQKIRTLEQINEKNKNKVDSLEQSLRKRFEEIAKLTSILQERDEIIRHADRFKAEAIRQFGQLVMLSISNTHFKRVFAGLFRKKFGSQLSQAKLFDEKWYLETYADISHAGVDPVLHYLCYGAKEGRQPNGFLGEVLPPDREK